MIQRLRTRLRRRRSKTRQHVPRIAPNVNSSQKAHSKVQQENRLERLFFPTRSRVKLHQSHASKGEPTALPLNEHVVQLNQRAVDVQTGIESSISSLQTQRLQHLTALNDKTRDLERAASALEQSSSKHLKQELHRTRQASYLFKVAIGTCLVLVSFMFGYIAVQWSADRRSA